MRSTIKDLIYVNPVKLLITQADNGLLKNLFVKNLNLKTVNLFIKTLILILNINKKPRDS